MSATQYLIDSLTRHQVFIQRHAGSINKTATTELEQMFSRVFAQLLSTPDARLFSTSQQIAELITNDIGTNLASVAVEIGEFAEYEAEFANKLITPAVKVDLSPPSKTQILAALNNSVMTLTSGKSVKQLTMSRMFERYAELYGKTVENVIRDGIGTGKTTAELVAELKPVSDRAKDDLKAVIITAANNAGTVGRDAFYKENDDVIEFVEWVSVLDSRTTIICASRDDKKYPVDSGPRPPAHYRCRSIVVPVINPKYAIPGFTGQRSSEFGPTSTATTYNSFLKLQSKEYQEAVLGKKRAALFRSGVNIDKFIDDDGRTLTLDELVAMEGITL